MEKNIYDGIDLYFSVSNEESWDDKTKDIDLKTIINEADNCFDFIGYVNNHLRTEKITSYSGWTMRSVCPFHKDGHERTASFFINSEKKRFYCHACGISGGAVKYISLKHKRPERAVAEYILSNICGKTSINLDAGRRIEEQRKKTLQKMIYMSNVFRNFLRSHVDDAESMEYANRAIKGFDLLCEADKESVENNIDEIAYNLENYLKLYI